MDVSKHWKKVVDTLQDALLVVDSHGTILAVNPAVERLTGYAAGELVGNSCRILNCTGCAILGPGSGADWCELYAKGDVRMKNCTITHKNRRAVHIVKSASVLRDAAGQIIGAVETLSDMSEVVRQQQEIANLRRSLNMEEGYHGLLGKSVVMQDLFELIDNVAPSDAPVMIQGESGSGKELVAMAIHEVSPHHSQPFIKVNCAALNENLLESELFGHAKGAYTGAERTRIGRFEAAHGGTIFLDEIGDIPLSTQVKLLRVLEEKQVERVGDHTPIPINVRILSATNKNLEALIAQGHFREDLYFRINVFPLLIPPLNRRREDIPLIVQRFIERNAVKGGKQITGIAAEAMEKLLVHPWPGNVRELRNAIDYAFVLCPGPTILPQHLPPRIPSSQPNACPPTSAPERRSTERDALIAALRSTGGNQSQASRILGVSRVTVWKRMKKYRIDLS